MTSEAIILAGGLGTRLRSAVPDLPKCMAPVAGKPFVGYLIDELVQQGVTRFIFSLGYKHELVEGYLHEAYCGLDIEFSVEEKPLGTGGAIRLAASSVKGKHAFILNGDTFFKVDVTVLDNFHVQSRAHCTLTLKRLDHIERYGVVTLGTDQRVTSFKEKNYYPEGLINGGVYALNMDAFMEESLPEAFSFERDYLEKLVGLRAFYGLVQEGYFIDIGIPADFQRAQEELIHHINSNA